MQECKPIKVPIPIGVRLSTEQCPKTQEEEEDMSHVPYASAAGSLMHAMVCTRQTLHMQWEFGAGICHNQERSIGQLLRGYSGICVELQIMQSITKEKMDQIEC